VLKYLKKITFIKKTNNISVSKNLYSYTFENFSINEKQISLNQKYKTMLIFGLFIC